MMYESLRKSPSVRIRELGKAGHPAASLGRLWVCRDLQLHFAACVCGYMLALVFKDTKRSNGTFFKNG